MFNFPHVDAFHSASYCQNCSIPHGHPSDHFRLGDGLGVSAHLACVLVDWTLRLYSESHSTNDFFHSDTSSSGRHGIPIVLLRFLFFWDMMSHQLLIGTYYPLTRRYIPEEQNLQLHHRKNLKTRTIFSFFDFSCARGLTHARTLPRKKYS